MKCPYCNGTGDISNPTFGALMVAARRAAGLSQLQVAERVGRSRSQIANIETDRSDIPITLLMKIAEALGCSPKDLLPL